MAKTPAQKLAGLKAALEGFNVVPDYPQAYDAAQAIKNFRDEALAALTDESESSSSSSSSSAS